MSTEFGISRRNLAKLGVTSILGGLVGNVPEGGKTHRPHSLWYNLSMSDLGVEVNKINGVEIVSAGKEGPNIIFLHPAGQPPLGMIEHIGQLGEVGQVIAPNIFDLIAVLQHRGIKNPGFADIVNEFMSLDILDKGQKTGLVAASIGGQFAWEYTAQKPQEVEFITAGSPTGWPFKRALSEWIMEFVKEFVWEASTQVPAELKKKDPGAGLFIRQVRKDPVSVWHGLKLAMNADSRQVMEGIQQPVDLLWGRKDNYIPLWTGEKMATLMINGRLQVVSGYNHMWVNLEPGKLTGPAIQRIQTPTAG